MAAYLVVSVSGSLQGRQRVRVWSQSRPSVELWFEDADQGCDVYRVRGAVDMDAVQRLTASMAVYAERYGCRVTI